MRKLFAGAVAFSMIAAAGVAGATTFWNPRFADIAKLRASAQSIAKEAGSILRRARVQSRRGRHFGWQRRHAMNSIRHLERAALRFRAVNFRSSGATVSRAFQRLAGRFRQAQKSFRWLRPRPFLRAAFASIGASIRGMRPAVRRVVANAYRPFPRFRPQIRFRKFPRPAPKVQVKRFPRPAPRAKVTYVPYGSNPPVAYAAAPSPNYVYTAPGLANPRVTIYQTY